MRRFYISAWLAMVLVVPGCGTGLPTTYANSVIGADGQPIALEDVEDITSHPNLTDDQRREQLRDLGIEDEVLIEALVNPIAG